MAKAMSEVIAMILALMIVLSISTGMYYWYSRMQTSQAGTAEQSHNLLLHRTSDVCVSVADFVYSAISNMSHVALYNCGSADITVGDANSQDTLTIMPNGCVITINSAICASCPAVLKPGELKVLALSLCKASCAINNLDEKQMTISIDGSLPTGVSFVPVYTATEACVP